MTERLLFIFLTKLQSNAIASGRDEILVCDVEAAIAAVEEALAERGINPAMLKDQS